MTNGRPGSMCGVKGLFPFKEEILLMDPGMPANADALSQHRTLFTTPGGMHVKEVTLNGAESSILSFNAQELQNAPRTVGEGQRTSPLAGQGTLVPFVSRGLQLGPSHKCAPRVMRPGTRERNRVRSFSRRLGEGHGQFRNWRVSGACLSVAVSVSVPDSVPDSASVPVPDSVSVSIFVSRCFRPTRGREARHVQHRPSRSDR